MKIFAIGGIPEDPSKSEDLKRFCFELGKQLDQKSVELNICSPFSDAVDRHIIESLKDAHSRKVSFALYYPKDTKVEEAWNDLLKNVPSEIKVGRFRQESTGLDDPRPENIFASFAKFKG